MLDISLIKKTFFENGDVIFESNKQKIYQIENLFLKELKDKKYFEVYKNLELLFIIIDKEQTVYANESILDNFFNILKNKQQQKMFKDNMKKWRKEGIKNDFMNEREKELLLKMREILKAKNQKTKIIKELDLIMRTIFNKRMIKEIELNEAEAKRKKDAQKTFRDIERMVGSQSSKYPNDTNIENKDPEEIMDILNELDHMFENSEENEN
jgi:hypothetical protein